MSVDPEGLEIQVGMLRLRVRPTDVDRRVAVVEPVAVEKLAAVVTGRTALPIRLSTRAAMIAPVPAAATS